MENEKTYDLILRVVHANKSNNLINLITTLSDETQFNVKVTVEQFENIQLGEVYFVNVSEKFNGTRTQVIVNNFTPVLEKELTPQLEEALRVFYKCAPVSLIELKTKFYKFIKFIKNKTVKTFVTELLTKYEKQFLVFPAGKSLHHAYIGGLLYHTVSMLELAEGFTKTYTSLNVNYLYAGIILHDVMKVEELTGAVDCEYSVKGQLFGHILLVCTEIDKIAFKHNLMDTEEYMVLKHILVSHHGQLEFGSPKKPATLEALVISMIDQFDAKIRTVEEELELIEESSFTMGIRVLDKNRIYKPKK